MKLIVLSSWAKYIGIASLLSPAFLGSQSTKNTPKTMAVEIIPGSSGLELAIENCKAGVAGAAQRHGYQLVQSRSGIPTLTIIINIINVSHVGLYGDREGDYDRDVRVATGGWKLGENKYQGIYLASDTEKNAHMDVVCVAITNGAFGDK